MSEIVFSREPAPSLFEELIPLLAQHYNEIAVSMGEPLEPDWAQYEALEKIDMLRVFTARGERMENRARGELVGYAVFSLYLHPHSRLSKQAMADLIYIDPRRRGFGAQFIRWCDEQLRQAGARVVYHSVTPYCDFGMILERQGYQQTGTQYAKRLVV